MLVIQSVIERLATPLAFSATTENTSSRDRRRSRFIPLSSNHRHLTFWPGIGRLLALLMLGAWAASANVCSPLNVPANGAFTAVVNGLDYLDWGSVRVQWTTDATPSSPVTEIQIKYATATEWTANPGVYPHTQGIFGGSYDPLSITSSQTILGGILTNISPSTTYHVIGQAMQGSTWCTATDVTFTTPARPAVWSGPVPPVQVNVTQPSMNGTHWYYGGGGPAGTTPCGDSGTATQRWQNCLTGASPGSGTGAQPGDDIAAAPGVYQITNYLNLPDNPAWKAITCVTGTNVCTQTSGTPPSNGTTVIFYGPPPPVNPGVPYKMINVSGSTFQISYDGSTPITFTGIGGDNGSGSNLYYMPYPLPQSSYITIHPTTYGTSALPPAGVRLGPDSITQYQPNMITFEDMDPTLGNGFLNYGSPLYTSLLAAGIWFQNIAFTTDPTVATSAGNGLDPIGFRIPMELGQGYASTSFVWNQCAFLFSLPPSRSGLMTVNGSNIAVINSYQQGLDWWAGHWYMPYPSTPSNTTTTITFPANTASWVGPGGTTGTKQQCVNTGGTWTITGGSTTTPGLFWISPSNCHIQVQTLPGLTVSTTGEVDVVSPVAAPTVTNVGTPGSTTYSYIVTATDSRGNETTAAGVPYNVGVVSPAGITTTGNATLSGTNYNSITWVSTGAACYNVYQETTYNLVGHVCGTTTYHDTGVLYANVGQWNFPDYLYISPNGTPSQGTTVFSLGGFNVTSGAITFFGIGNPGASQQNATFEVATGFYGSSIVGPYLFDNDYGVGAGIVGVYLSGDPTDLTTPCTNQGVPCAIAVNAGNLTETRNTWTTNPCFWYDASCWNGGNYYWRNFSEMKQGKWVYQDGNQYGPMPSEVGLGACALHETYNGGSLYGYGLVYTGFPAYTDSNEWTFTNNTCTETGEGVLTAFAGFATGAPIKNILVRNNLFLNNNGYSNTAINQPRFTSRTFRQDADLNCPDGQFSNWIGSGQNVVLDHNTVWGMGGCLPAFLGAGPDIESGVQYTNNIFNLVLDPGAGSAYPGTLYQPYNGTDTCAGYLGSALLNCYNLLTYRSNIQLPTYTNSMPGSSVEFTTSTIANTLAATPYPTSPAGYTPNANTLAGRIAQVGWFNACTLTSASSCVNNLRLLNSSAYNSGSHTSTDGLDIGANIDQLEQHQGKVSNVRTYGATSTGVTIAWYAPDSNACPVDWGTGTSAFYNGSGSWTRVSGTGGQRVQTVSLTGIPAHSLVYYRVNCQVQQPTGSVQLP